MKDDNCIFCKIANGEIPSRTLYEDEDFRVIMDLAPATKGHSLIMPKNHYKNIYEIADDTAAKMTEKLGADGFNIVQNNNEVAGQTVFHFHVHLIPRYNNDNQSLVMKPQEMTDALLDEIRDTIVK